jgi:signal transduction histidine kinase
MEMVGQLGPTHGERRLLLVEDDGELRNSLSDLLRGDGYQVIGASNGSEALDCLRKGPAPDLILLDLMMPVKDGWQFRIEQKRDPSMASIPVLALSADDSPKAVAIDAEGYIKKPFHYTTLLGAIRKVLDERRLAHLDRLASLGTLAAGIAHEINNPLTYLIANLELLEEEMPRLMQLFTLTATRPGFEGPGPEVAARFQEMGAQLRDAIDGAKRVRGIVSDVKMFSRAGDDLRAFVDVQSVLESTLRVVIGELRQRARVVTKYQPTPLVLANPGQLGQVFLNMLLNAAHAIEAADPDKNTIGVATRVTATGEVLVEISDTGCGIDPGLQRRIFDPFFTTKPVGVGTGLGLSICHGIVRSLGGSITVESQVGAGATFRITLPASDKGGATPAKTVPSPLPK